MMKRTLLLTMFALLVMGSRSLADDYGTKPAGAKPEAAKTAAMSEKKGDAALLGKLEMIERKLWDSFKNQDFKAMKENMAVGALSVDMNGCTPFDAFEPMMKDYAVDSFTLQDWKIVPLDKDAAIITYSVTVNAKYKGEAIPTGPYYSSTVYTMHGGKWLALYHQETLAASAMPPAAATSTGQ